MESKHIIFWILNSIVLAGALNWGLVAINGDKTNAVKAISMGNKTFERAAYGVVGASAVALIVMTIAFEAGRAKAEKEHRLRA